MEVLLFLILLILCLIYLYQTTGYRPVWSDFLWTQKKSQKSNKLSINLYMMFPKESIEDQTTEDLQVSPDKCQKILYMNDGLCMSSVNSLEEWLIEERVDKSIVESIFLLNGRDSEKRYCAFSESRVRFVCRDDEIKKTASMENDSSLGEGWLRTSAAAQEAVLYIECSPKCYREIKEELTSNRAMSATFHCFFQIEDQKVKLHVISYNLAWAKKHSEFTLQHQLARGDYVWCGNEVDKKTKATLDKMFPSYQRLYERFEVKKTN
jgi:hypothetical protein